MAEEVKLLGTLTSPFTRRVELALRLKGVGFELIEEDLINKSPLLLQCNPIYKKIPVLIHNGKPIAESIVIIEYIDEVWPNVNPLLPEDPYDRARARFWVKLIEDKILQTSYKLIKLKDKELEATIEDLSHHLKLLENELNGKQFFGGDSIGFLDIVAFYLAYWTNVWQTVTGPIYFTEERFPIFHEYIGRMCEIDVVKESLPSKEKHIASIRARLEAMKSASK